jgi:hypothetical protein
LVFFGKTGVTSQQFSFMSIYIYSVLGLIYVN